MFYCNNDINELIRQINAKLYKLNVRFSVNRLSLSITKTNYIIFLEIAHKKINKVIINRVEATNVLDVLIDDKLTWKHRIFLLISKLSKCCAIM